MSKLDEIRSGVIVEEETLPPVVDRPAYDFVTPTGSRLLVTKPRDAGRRSGDRRTRGGLIIPRSVHQRESAVVCEIVRCGPDVTLFRVGEIVMLAEFSGIAILDDISHADNAWLVSQDEVVGRVDMSYWQEFGDDDERKA